MIALYQPGDTLLHRLPAAVKLAGLTIGALAVSLWPASYAASAITAAVAVLVLVVGRMTPRMLLRQFSTLIWIAALLFVSQLIFGTLETAVIATVRIASIVLIAGAVTTTTTTGDIVAVIEKIVTPLRVFGVDPWRVGFTLTLTLAIIPVVSNLAAQVRLAARARRVRPGIRSIVTLVVLTLRFADDLGDALAARGLA